MTEVVYLDGTGEVEHDFMMVSQNEQLEYFAPAMAPLIQEFVERAGDGEMLVEDVFRQLLEGKALAFLWAARTPEGPSVKMLMVTEVVEYPRLRTMNIVVLAGKNFDEFFENYWIKFTGWAYTVGVRAVEGYVHDAMARMMAKWGFEKKSVLVRQKL